MQRLSIKPAHRLSVFVRYGDYAFAALLIVVMQVDVWAHHVRHPIPVAGVALLLGLSLFAARHAPLSGPIVSLLIIGVLATVSRHDLTNVSTPMFALLFLSWSIGANNSFKRALAGLALVIGVMAYVSALALDGGISGNLGWLSAFFVSAWAAGIAIRRRIEREQQLTERAVSLEADKERLAIEAVADERQRIARELHDVIAHSVSVMTVQAGAVRRLLLPEQERERQALLTVEETGRQALTEMRRLVGLLRERGATPEFSPQPSMKRLDTLIGTVREAGLPVELAVDGQPRDLAPGIDLSAYRIVQEALTNALKYAGPARAWVTVRYRDGEVELEIANDGQGDGNGDGGGHGLAGMRERVSLYGGTVDSGPRDGGGFVVRAQLPTEATP